MGNAALPLARYTVLDFTHVRSGPSCVRQLADWGARVIKIERPPSDGAQEAYTGKRLASDFQNLHRNKESLTLDLKAPESKDILRRLIERADVVVENFRPDVKARLGLDYEQLRAINKRIVLGSISGFGQDGPYADRPGVDQIAQGMSGIMSVTGPVGHGPYRVGTAIGDVTAGLYLAIGILSALLERETSGEGQWVHTSLVEALIAVMDFQSALWLMEGVVPGQAGNNHPRYIPTGTFRASDGYINVGGGDEAKWRALCDILGRPELTERPEYDTQAKRLTHRDRLNAELETVIETRPTAHWVEVMNAAGIPCGPIYSVDQVFADPQVRHLGMAAKVNHPQLGEIELVGQPIHMSRTPWQMRNAAPGPGAETDSILAEFGFAADQIATFHDKQVV